MFIVLFACGCAGMYAWVNWASAQVNWAFRSVGSSTPPAWIRCALQIAFKKLFDLHRKLRDVLARLSHPGKSPNTRIHGTTPNTRIHGHLLVAVPCRLHPRNSLIYTESSSAIANLAEGGQVRRQVNRQVPCQIDSDLESMGAKNAEQMDQLLHSNYYQLVQYGKQMESLQYNGPFYSENFPFDFLFRKLSMYSRCMYVKTKSAYCFCST